MTTPKPSPSVQGVRPAPREVVHAAFEERGWEDCATWQASSGMRRPGHQPACDRETALLTRDREQGRAEADAFERALALRPGDAVEGIGTLMAKGVEGGHFVWWIKEGGVCSLNNLVAHMRALAAPLAPATTGTEPTT